MADDVAAQLREDCILSLRMREYWATASLFYWGTEAEAAEATAVVASGGAKAKFVCSEPEVGDAAAALAAKAREAAAKAKAEASIARAREAAAAAAKDLGGDVRVGVQRGKATTRKREEDAAVGAAGDGKRPRAAEASLDAPEPTPRSGPKPQDGARGVSEEKTGDRSSPEAGRRYAGTIVKRAPKFAFVSPDAAEDAAIPGAVAGDLFLHPTDMRFKDEWNVMDVGDKVAYGVGRRRKRLKCVDAVLVRTGTSERAAAAEEAVAEEAEAPAEEAGEPLEAPAWSVFVFHCDGATRGEVLSRRLFGAPFRALKDLKTHAPHARILYVLYDVRRATVTGPFLADGEAGVNLEAQAFKGRFRAQLRWQPHPSYKSFVVAKSPRLGQGFLSPEEGMELFQRHFPKALSYERKVEKKRKRRKRKKEEKKLDEPPQPRRSPSNATQGPTHTPPPSPPPRSSDAPPPWPGLPPPCPRSRGRSRSRSRSSNDSDRDRRRSTSREKRKRRRLSPSSSSSSSSHYRRRRRRSRSPTSPSSSSSRSRSSSRASSRSRSSASRRGRR